MSWSVLVYPDVDADVGRVVVRWHTGIVKISRFGIRTFRARRAQLQSVKGTGNGNYTGFSLDVTPKVVPARRASRYENGL